MSKCFRADDAEASVLGAVLLDDRKIDDIASTLKPEHFRNDILGKVYSIAIDMRTNGRPIDAVTITQAIEARKLDEQLPDGAIHLVMELMEKVPHSEHVGWYAGMVIAAWQRREGDSAAGRMRMAFADPSIEALEAMATASAELRAIEEAIQPQTSCEIGDVMASVLNDRSSAVAGIQTGFPTVDHMTTGLHGGQLIIIAARPGIGKSAFVANVATNIVENDTGVLFVSLEMSKADLIYRLVARMTGLTMREMRGNDASVHRRMLDAMNSMNHWKLFIDDTVPQTVSQIAAKTRGLVRRGKVKVLIVDYLQLIQPTDRKAPREQQVAAMSRDLKVLGKQLKIPVIALSQLNRDTDKTGRRPRLSDLRESGAIEQDADLVGFVHRPGAIDGTESATDAELIIEKQRQGPTGVVKMEWNGPRYLFTEAQAGGNWK